MKRLLNYGRHWFRSKGRHGTHSPFVYAFVEQVLRNKNKIKTQRVRQLPLRQTALPLREMKLLYKSLYFLKPEYVLLPDDTGLDWIKDIMPFIVPGAAVKQVAGFDYTAGGQDGLLLMPAADRYRSCCQKAIRAGMRVLVFNPHTATDTPGLWNDLYTDPEVNMSLDYWYFGLLIHDAAFKQKQHFRLR